VLVIHSRPKKLSEADLRGVNIETECWVVKINDVSSVSDMSCDTTQYTSENNLFI
jgi:hypothetical protein